MHLQLVVSLLLNPWCSPWHKYLGKRETWYKHSNNLIHTPKASALNYDELKASSAPKFHAPTVAPHLLHTHWIICKREDRLASHKCGKMLESISRCGARGRDRGRSWRGRRHSCWNRHRRCRLRRGARGGPGRDGNWNSECRRRLQNWESETKALARSRLEKPVGGRLKT